MTELFADESPHPISICEIDLVSHKSTLLFASPEFHSIGSAEYSPDGRLIAFDAQVPGKHSTSSSHIFTCRPDGSNLTDLGAGTLPSWSPRGRRICFSRNSPEFGVWIMNSDGTNPELLDNRGWSARWSPDGQTIAYIRTLNGHDDFVLFSLVEDEMRSVFGPDSKNHDRLHAGFAWSADSCRLAYKAQKATDTWLGVTNVEEGTHQVVHTAEYIGPVVSWIGANRIVFSLGNAIPHRHTLHSMDLRSSTASPTPGQPENWSNACPAVNQAGTKLLFVRSSRR